MNEINTGGPAFPAMHFDLADNERGMTLRDYFAAKAMQGFAAYSGTRSDPMGSPECAYIWADAMLEARKMK